MGALSIRLPHSLHERLREMAVREGVSINQLVVSALTEKMTAILTADHLDARARRGSREKYLAALARVPDAEPEPRDRLDAGQPAGRVQEKAPRYGTAGRVRRKVPRPR